MNRRTPLAATTLLVVSLAAACQPAADDPPASPQGGAGGKGGRGGGGSGGDTPNTGGTGGVTPVGGSSGAGGTVPDGGSMTDTGSPGEVGATACMGEAATYLLCDPLRKMPMTIKATGLFPSAPDFSKRDPRLLEFVPDPPLWSDGMEKQRFLLLPPGKKIDNSDRKQWKFPEGTLITKTFFDDTGPGGTPRPIETRFIRSAKNVPYEYFVYKWNAQGTDATLIVNDQDGDVNKDEMVPITINHTKDGKPFTVNAGKPFMHTLPSRSACSDCHEENGMVSQTYIGFDELRLNNKRTPTSAKTQLQEFGDLGIFTAAIPAQPATITDANPTLLRVKRFVFGNCVHCHNGGGQVSFYPDDFVKNTVNVEVAETQSVHPPPGMLRIWGKDIRKSVVYVQTERTMLPPPYMADGQEYRLRPMPPVGVEIADQESLADMRAWIATLPVPPARPPR